MSVMQSLFRWVHGSSMQALSALPGPAPSFPFGNALDLLGDTPWETCGKWGQQYGPVTLIWIFGSPALVLNGASSIAEVLEGRWNDFYKASPTEALRPVITDNCPFICNGADWKFKRENHPFSIPGLDPWMDTQVAPMSAALAKGLDRLVQRGAPVDLLSAMLRLSFDTFSVAVWGRELGDDAFGWFMQMGAEGSFRIKSPVPQLPALDPRFWYARSRWYGLYSQLIDEAKQRADPARGDLMAVLLRRGTKLQPDGFRDSLANIFFGGVFSVASALATALYVLAREKEIGQRLRAAVDAIDMRAAGFDRAKLDGCADLDHVLRETLRWECPVPLYSRNTLVGPPITFAGTTLPSNTTVFITNRYLHRDPTHWKDPDRFDPERWANGGVERDPIGSGWFFPFGRGPRMCVGEPFAMFYMKLALASLVARTAVSMDPWQKYVQRMFFGVMSPQDLEARFAAR